MRPVPDRRQFLQASGVALLAGVVGCLSDPSVANTDSPTPTPTPALPSTPQTEGTYANTPSGPEPYPDRPDDLTRSSVLQYVEDFEFATTTNTLHRDNVEEISVRSRSLYDTAAYGGHWALASCSGYANYADGVHADWGQRPALYFVGPQLTVRVEEFAGHHYFHCEDVFAADDPEQNFAEVCEGGDASYLAYNYHPEPHTVSVTVEFLGDGDDASDSSPETVLERTYEMGAATALLQESVTYRRGMYRLTATLESGRETTYRWDLGPAPSYDDPPVTVLVTPVGGITVRRPPFPEVR